MEPRVDICVHDHFQPIEFPMGLKQMITRLHVEWYSVEDRHDGASVVSLVLRASARTGCKIKRLIADIRSFSATLLRTETATPETAGSGEFEAFEELEELTINAIAPPQVLVAEEGLLTCLVLILAIPQAFEKTGIVARNQIF